MKPLGSASVFHIFCRGLFLYNNLLTLHYSLQTLLNTVEQNVNNKLINNPRIKNQKICTLVCYCFCDVHEKYGHNMLLFVYVLNCETTHDYYSTFKFSVRWNSKVLNMFIGFCESVDISYYYCSLITDNFLFLFTYFTGFDSLFLCLPQKRYQMSCGDVPLSAEVTEAWSS